MGVSDRLQFSARSKLLQRIGADRVQHLEARRSTVDGLPDQALIMVVRHEDNLLLPLDDAVFVFHSIAWLLAELSSYATRSGPAA